MTSRARTDPPRFGGGDNRVVTSTLKATAGMYGSPDRPRECELMAAVLGHKQ